MYYTIKPCQIQENALFCYTNQKGFVISYFEGDVIGEVLQMQLNRKKTILSACVFTAAFILNACAATPSQAVPDGNDTASTQTAADADESARSAVNFEHELDS